MGGANQPSTDLIRAYLEAVIRKGATAVDRFFDSNVEYMLNGTALGGPEGVLPPISAECHSTLPWPGLYRGREAVKGFLEHMHQNLEIVASGPREVISQGAKAAAFGWFRLRALATDQIVDISYSILFEVLAGLIIRYHFLENTFDVAGAFRRDGSWVIDTDGEKHRVPAFGDRQEG